MAATSSSSSSSSRGPRNKHTDSFRPQFPLNPFSSYSLAPKFSSSSISSTLNEPWLLKPDQALFSTVSGRTVILVLGTPSERCVAALLASHSLVHSLVILASHCPPVLPSGHAPAVRVLRLAFPLAVEDTGAVRLVSTLEWAERVARVWRASGSDDSDIVYYDEATKDVPATATATRPSSFSYNLFSATSGSVESLGKKSFSSMKGLSIFTKRRLSTSSTMSGLFSTGSLPPIDTSQRPFDAILNYISHDVAEKHILKQTILVASITRPFLAPTLSPYHKLSEAKKNRRRSTNQVYSLPPTPPYQSGDLLTPASPSATPVSVLSTSPMPPPSSHMVHIVPPTARVGLIRSLDSFLASFSQQAVGPEEVNLAKQYILNSSTVRQAVVHPRFDQDEHTVLDLILLGGLDSVSGKAWIGSGQDILFLPTSGSSSASSTPSMSRKPVRSPSRARSDSSHFADSVSPSRARVRSSPQLLYPLSLSSGGSPEPRRSNSTIPERSQPLSNQDGFAFSLRPRLDHLRHPHPQSPHQSLLSGISSGRTIRRSKLNMTTQPDNPIPSTSGLPTPPDSDEDSRQVSPQPRTPASEVSTPQKKRWRWQFWKS